MTRNVVMFGQRACRAGQRYVRRQRGASVAARKWPPTGTDSDLQTAHCTAPPRHVYYTASGVHEPTAVAHPRRNNLLNKAPPVDDHDAD